MAKAKRRQQTPRRYRNIPGHASVEKARQVVAETLGLPIESVQLRFPSGRQANYNSSVESLRERWEGK
jgi:hypothetical protein